MNFVALKMLVGDRLKYLALVAGVSFAALLITQQASIFAGYTLRTGSWIRETTAGGAVRVRGAALLNRTARGHQLPVPADGDLPADVRPMAGHEQQVADLDGADVVAGRSHRFF